MSQNPAVLTAQEAKEMAKALYDARASLQPISAFTASRPELGLMDGYAIQTELVSMLLADGEEIVGYKLGLTSKPMQELLGVDRPDFGPVFASTVFNDGAIIDVNTFISPRMEAEIGIVLGEDLSGPNCTPADALRASAGAVASLEIVDSRIADWKIKLADTVGDLASNGAIALSSRVIPIDFDLRTLGMVFTKNGQHIATGAGAAAMGDPLIAVAWIANTLAPMGITLKAGHVIMTGALHAMVPVAPGDVFRADFDRLGPVTISMV